MFKSEPKSLNLTDSYNKPTERDKLAFQQAKGSAAPPKRENRLHFKFDRTLTGEQLASSLKESLCQHNINPDDVMIRYFSKKRLQHALQTGSDRDSSSRVVHNGGADGEQEWMDTLGIYDNNDVAFVGPIGSRLVGGVDTPDLQDHVYVIFDKKCLYKVGRASNGFHTFLTTPYQANIGFISDQGDIELPSFQNLRARPFGVEGPS